MKNRWITCAPCINFRRRVLITRLKVKGGRWVVVPLALWNDNSSHFFIVQKGDLTSFGIELSYLSDVKLSLVLSYFFDVRKGFKEGSVKVRQLF
jgi:hypothetical protein